MLFLADLQSNNQVTAAVVRQDFQVPPTIQIGTVESFIAVIVFVFGVGVAWATIKSSVANLDKTINGEIKPVLTDLRDRFAVVEDRVESLWKDKVVEARSPRCLNDRGLEILQKSGIKEIVDENRSDLEARLRAQSPTTSYDAERAAILVIMDLPERSPDILARLKNGAFNVGAELNTVLLVGGMYLRDEILPNLALDNAES